MTFPFPSMMMQPAVAGGGLSDKWRLALSVRQSTGPYTVAEFEMRETIGGTDICTGGTPTASSDNGTNVIANGFDDNASTYWQSANTSDQTIDYQFSTTKTPVQFSITAPTTGFQSLPKTIALSHWDGSAWQTDWTETNSDHWDPGFKRVYTKYDSGTPGYFKWRLNITAIQSAGSWAAIRELEFRTSAGGADQTAPITTTNEGDCYASANSSTSLNAPKAFDGTTTRWTTGTATLPQQIQYRFVEQKAIVEVAMTAWSTPGDTPKTFDVQYYDPVTASWVTSWSVADTGTWTSGETKVFTKP